MSATQEPVSVADRILAFFRSCPEEELSVPQIAVKFGCARKTVYSALYNLRQNGEIEGVFVVRRRQVGIAKETQHG